MSHPAFLFPELPRGQRGAFCHGLELRKNDVRVHRRLPDPGAITAVASGDHVFAPHSICITSDTLRDQFGVFDEIRLRLDDARNEYLAVRQLYLLERGP